VPPIITPPVTSFQVPYADFSTWLANAFDYPDPISYPPISALKVEQRFNSDTNTTVPGVSTVYIWPKTALRVSDVNYKQINGSPFGDNAAIDAFGRLRVSAPQTLLDSKLLYDKQPAVFDEVKSASATSTHVPGDALVLMETSLSGDYVVRQTPARFNYSPGKSLLCVNTFIAAPEVNVVKRIGMFSGLSAAPYSPSDGIYLEITSGGAYFNILKTIGTLYSVSVPQSAWNIDPLNGTGSSGLNIDFTKGQIFAIDYEWLGLGRVRFGFYLEGKLFYAHQVTNLNTLTAPYISSPNHPVRYEIRQTGPGTGSLKQVCSSITSEGSIEEIGTAATASTSAAITVQSNVLTPIIAVRCQPFTPDLTLLLKQFDIYNTTNNVDVKYVLIRNPSITGGNLTFNKADNNNMEYALGTTTLSVSGGYDLISGFVFRSQGTSRTPAAQDLAGTIGRFGVKINGTPETLVLAGLGLGGQASVYAAMNTLIKS